MTAYIHSFNLPLLYWNHTNLFGYRSFPMFVDEWDLVEDYENRWLRTNGINIRRWRETIVTPSSPFIKLLGDIAGDGANCYLSYP